MASILKFINLAKPAFLAFECGNRQLLAHYTERMDSMNVYGRQMLKIFLFISTGIIRTEG